MPAKPKFTREQLQRAALRIVDEQGLDALSMRALAAALGTGPMTLYNYFRDRDELNTLLVEAVFGEVALPDMQAAWQQEAMAILESMWRAIRMHPNVIPLVLMRRTSHETTLGIAEALLRALARSGCSPAVLLATFRTLNGFVMGLAQAQLGAAPGGAGGGADPHVAEVGLLSEERFPRLREIAAIAAQTHSDDEFRAGVELILAGLMAQQSAGKHDRKAPKTRAAAR